MLKLENVSKYYTNGTNTNLGLRNINLEFHTGEIVAITGESGSGKSTLLNVITKMDTFDEGEIYYKGNETSYFSIDDMDNFRKNKVGFIFQNYNIIDSYTVLENVMMPYTLNGIESKQAKQKAIELIEKVGLKKRINNRGSQLSGGEKQRCVIARALASNAEILACDEPTGNLDSKTGAEIISLIKEVAQDKLVLIVTHNFESVKHIVTRNIKVHDGEIIEDISINNAENKDQDEILDLDYVKLPKKIGFNVALKNILRTPKKTILTCLVFFFVSLFAISLYQSILYLNYHEYDNNPFLYDSENKLLVYDIEHNKLDKSYFENLKNQGSIYGYEFNKFYATQKFYLYSDEYQDSFEYTYQDECILQGGLDKGRMPENDQEVFVFIPRKYLEYDKDFLIDKLVYLYSNVKIGNEYSEYSFKVVGYKILNDLKDGILISGNKNVERVMQLSAFTTYSSLNYIFKVKVYNAGVESNIGSYYEFAADFNSPTSYVKYDQSKIHIDSATLDDFYIGEYKIMDACNLDVVEFGEKDYSYANIIFYIGQDIFDAIENNPYEAFIYSKIPQITASKISSDGYSYLKINGYTQGSKIDAFINNLWGYFAIFMASISIFVIYFISYIVLAKIYQSKRKDYTIIRTLGITKKDMKFVVLSEVLINCMIISIITFILVFILGKTVHKSIFQIFENIKVFTAILYFIVMFVFGFFIARRFNRRLFKFSVNSTLKAEEVKND